MVLRRASELNARRRVDDPEETTISSEVLVQVAAAAGIPESDVRRAVRDLLSDNTAESHSLARKLYGPSRLRMVREIEYPTETAREYLEYLLRIDQGLKLRRKTEGSSLWDSGDMVGMVRRALDFSGERALLKANSIELRVEEVDGERCGANLTADVSNQRGEYLSLGGIVGATLALPVAIAGAQNPLFLLAVIPALAAPGVGFKFAYDRARAEIRRSLDKVLDRAEAGPPKEERVTDRGDRPPGQIRGLRPIPRFTPDAQEEE